MEVEIIRKTKNRKDVMAENLKVCAYARVSTELDGQVTSFDSQLKYYRDKIKRNTNWTFVKVYSDYGISGTQTNKRDEFIEMIEDALNGKIDLIITKSISRFARNTLDTLKYVRMLKSNNIGIVFEEEHINTLNMNGEMLLTVLSSVAQQESETISSHVRLGFEMKMKRGELIGFKRCYGYRIDKKNNTLKINKKEAENVRLIFKLYLDGNSISSIANILSEKKLKNYNKTTKWKKTSIQRILKNEEYVGDLIQGKTCVDPVTHKEVLNVGQQRKYYIKDHHQAIISREDFEKVQELMKANATRKPKERIGLESLNETRTFTRMLRCGFCGRYLTINKANYRYYWRCRSYRIKKKNECIHSKAIKEDIIKNAFVDCYNLLLKNSFNNLDSFISSSLKLKEDKKIINKLKRLKQEKEKCVIKTSRLADLFINNKINKYNLKAKQENLEEKIVEYDKAITKLENKKDDYKQIEQSIKVLKDKLTSDSETMETFEETKFKKLVQFVIVGGMSENKRKNPYLIRFIYNNKSVFKIEKNDAENEITKNGLDKDNNKYIPILDFVSKQKFFYKEKDKNGNLIQKNVNGIRVRFEIEKVN